MSSKHQVVLVTGFPTAFLAVRVVRKLLLDERDVEIRCVVPPKFMQQAEEELARIDAPRLSERVRVLEGDVVSMDLGLSGAEFNALADEVEVIHHCAAVTYLGAERAFAEAVNVAGTREVVELADSAKHFERLVHWSSALVSGARRGYVLEEELDDSRGFRNPIEETRYRAERIVRRVQGRIPTTVLRPAILVGDSMTGEIDRFEGPYLLVLLMLNAPVDLRLPLPGRGETPLNLVPVDYVIEAGLAIANDPRSISRTFHITDPEPVTARRVFELIASAAGKPAPRGFLPTTLATTLLKAPGLEKFANVPRAFLEQLGTEVVWDDRNARELLQGKGLHCPQFASYVGTLVDYVRRHQSKRRADRQSSVPGPIGS
jgi:thioester reductase-like protein